MNSGVFRLTIYNEDRCTIGKIQCRTPKRFVSKQRQNLDMIIHLMRSDEYLRNKNSMFG